MRVPSSSNPFTFYESDVGIARRRHENTRPPPSNLFASTLVPVRYPAGYDEENAQVQEVMCLPLSCESLQLLHRYNVASEANGTRNVVPDTPTTGGPHAPAPDGIALNDDESYVYALTR